MSNLVQATIHVIGFPKTQAELEIFMDFDERTGRVKDWYTSIDELVDLGSTPDQYATWTAPRWIAQGDLLLFYHTQSAKQSVAKLLKEAELKYQELKSQSRWWVWGRAKYELANIDQEVKLLHHASGLADKYSGTIFACAEITRPSEYQEQEYESHFSGRSFAPLGRVHIFDQPLPAAEFTEFVKIGQGTPNTPLYERPFEGIKRKLAVQNRLPEFLANARIGGETFRNVDKDNWPSISCSPGARFVNEEQFRTYLLDYLLEELKDPRAPLLRECKCVRNGVKTGFADYFVRIGGDWIPVEAKLNMLSTPVEKLREQVGQYMEIDTFRPTLGSHRGEEYKTSGSPVCLLADQSGVYLVSKEGFVGCSPGEPVWRREALGHDVLPQIRKRIEAEVGRK